MQVVGQQRRVSGIVRVHAGQHESKDAPERVDVGADVGGRKPVLFGGGEPVGAEGGGVAVPVGRVSQGAGYAEVDDMGAVIRDDDIRRGQIAMEDAEPMQFLNGLADLLREVDGLALLQSAAFGDDLFQGGAGYVVEDDGHAVGQFVRGFDAGESRAGAAAQGRPNATLGQHGWDLLADERADAVDGDQFGDAAWAAGQDLFDVVGVVDAHRVHGPGVVHDSPLRIACAALPSGCGTGLHPTSDERSPPRCRLTSIVGGVARPAVAIRCRWPSGRSRARCTR